MISFKQFISEEEDLIKLEDLIRRDCKPFLEQATGLFLRRGVRTLNDSELLNVELDGNEIEVFKKVTRRDRKALSTSTHWHNLADEWFAGKFGLPARTQAVFCLGERGDESTLRSYGIPCMIFPIGEFSFVWSRKVSDLFSDIDDLPREIVNAYHNDGVEEARPLFYRWMDDKGYQDDNLPGALTAGHEIMMVCNSYYATRLDANKHNLQRMMRDFK